MFSFFQGLIDALRELFRARRGLPAWAEVVGVNAGLPVRAEAERD